MSGEVVDNPEVSNEEAAQDEEVVESNEEESQETEEGSGEEGEVDVDVDEEEVTEEEVVDDKEDPQNYKEAFKKHPELRKAFFENNQYKTVFPTPEDAQEAYEQVQVFQDFSTAIAQGDVNPIINAIIESNPQAFATFAENFLPNLQQMDARLFDRALAPSVANLLRSAIDAGQRNGNKNLELAAQHLSAWLFRDATPPNLKPSAPQPTQKDNVEGRSQEFYKELQDEVSVFLNSEALRNLDPNNVLPPALKKVAAKDIVDSAIAALKKNGQAQRQLQILRDKAHRSGYSYESRKAIRDAYNTMMRPIIARLKGPKRDEMMKSIGKDALGNKNKKVIPSGSAANSAKKKIDPKKIDLTRTSYRDVLDGNVKMIGDK